MFSSACKRESKSEREREITVPSSGQAASFSTSDVSRFSVSKSSSSLCFARMLLPLRATAFWGWLVFDAPCVTVPIGLVCGRDDTSVSSLKPPCAGRADRTRVPAGDGMMTELRTTVLFFQLSKSTTQKLRVKVGNQHSDQSRGVWLSRNSSPPRPHLRTSNTITRSLPLSLSGPRDTECSLAAPD